MIKPWRGCTAQSHEVLPPIGCTGGRRDVVKLAPPTRRRACAVVLKSWETCKRMFGKEWTNGAEVCFLFRSLFRRWYAVCVSNLWRLMIVVTAWTIGNAGRMLLEAWINRKFGRSSSVLIRTVSPRYIGMSDDGRFIDTVQPSDKALLQSSTWWRRSVFSWYSVDMSDNGLRSASWTLTVRWCIFCG